MAGMHGTYEANMGMHECDTLVAIGARFDDRVTGEIKSFCPHARIVHVDIDPASISKNVPVVLPIVGSVDSVLKDMIKLIKADKRKPDKEALQSWWAQIDLRRGFNCVKYDHQSKLIKPQEVIEKLYKITKGDALAT